MMEQWISEQMLVTSAEWDSRLTHFYPSALEWMESPSAYLKRITGECNYLNAAKILRWDEYICDDATLLDVGCGGGWLSAFLSCNSRIKEIIAIDSSSNYLNKFLPAVVSLLHGDIGKIKTVQGLFSPILMKSESVDIIAISSALHHAPALEEVLSEFNRVLKQGSYLIILNETPAGSIEFLYRICKTFLKIVFMVATKKYKPWGQQISANGILYDPYLGDIDHPLWVWREAINSTGFKLITVIDTKLPTVIGNKDRTLRHFVCKKL